MQNSVSKRGLLVLACAFALSACGFHLRGTGSLPFDTLYVQGDGAPDIARDLKRSLGGSGVKLTKTAEEAQASLELMSESGEKRILSLGSGGKVREYEILYRVVFRVRDAGNESWGGPQTVELRRDFSYDDTKLLAKDAEEARLAGDMHTEAVREILRRVGSLSKQKPAAGRTTTE
ncbi:MAG TPA: LPS assembly lipoprotein LptE [Novimethylophilus sp.]|jgi:LPS-assembly lipoprotein|uniref:LPS-assembly lipoprotein LptE n=1 Tax=Novimethylophilus sp. TaxID=2137426 RepID=UPI002F41ABEA